MAARQSRRVRLLIAYDGTGYRGWQKQNNGITIQGELEAQLKRMTLKETCLHGAGRTDAGVHAQGMVAHFDTCAAISARHFLRGLNSMLDPAIRVLAAKDCDPLFHARFSAIEKRYRYQIFTGEIQAPQARLYRLHIKAGLDLDRIKRCLDLLLGSHDFSSFENAGSRDKNALGGRGAVRTLSQCSLEQDGPRLFLEFTGDGFLRNMVRNMVGTLLEVGRGKISPEDFAGILAARNRAAGGPTAPAHGLCLMEVYYQDKKPMW